MIKLVLTAALLITIAGIAAAQQLETAAPPPRFERSLSGTIGGSLKIQMKLSGDKGRLIGSYFYEARKKPLRVEGYINEHGYFELDEYDTSGKVTGYFFGAFVKEDGLVGYWSRDMTPSNRLPFRLAESGKTAPLHKFSTINAHVRNDYGGPQFWLIDETIVAFEYDNVGGNGHTCTLIVDRSDQDVNWKSDADGLTIQFTKKYFKAGGDGFGIKVRKLAQGYEMTFEGDGSYFCGARAVLPRKVTISRTRAGWTGKAVRQ